MHMYQKGMNYASVYLKMANCLFWRVAFALVSHLEASDVIDNAINLKIRYKYMINLYWKFEMLPWQIPEISWSTKITKTEIKINQG